MGHEQKMIAKVEHWMERARYDDALSYLDGYLSKHDKSLVAWRYRVLIRLDQEKRAVAASEYSALATALGRQEPSVLAEVVLGAGGRWLLSDYKSLARCAPVGLADAAFFADLLEAKHLGEGSLTKVAVSSEELVAVVDALPGSLAAGSTWPLVQRALAHEQAEIRARGLAAVGRHLHAGGLSDSDTGAALEALRSGAASGEALLREEALVAALSLPEGPGRADFVGEIVSRLAAVGDAPRAVSLFLLGPSASGPAVWTEEQLQSWNKTKLGPLVALTRGEVVLRGGSRKAKRSLQKALRGGGAGVRLAGAVGAAAGSSFASVWSQLSTDERRAWGGAFVRGRQRDQGLWLDGVLGDSDALVVQGALSALAVTGLDATPEEAAALGRALSSDDASTRALAASTAVRRGALEVADAVAALLASGDDRAADGVLRALVATGAGGWAAAVQAALRSPLPMVRELAVDAAASSCDPAQREAMAALLSDDDPHVAVRAASALYLLIGTEP